MFKVLLVDDEVFVRKGLLELIPWEQLNYTITGEAENGREALQLMERLQPDLVITDIRMPIVDGLELIRNVKERNECNPAFVIISGYDDFKYAQQAMRYGVHDYILKPIDEEEMVSTLRKLSYTMSAMPMTLPSHRMLEALVHEEHGEQAERYAAALGLEKTAGFLYVVLHLHGATEDKLTSIKQLQDALQSVTSANFPVMEQRLGEVGILLRLDWLRQYGSDQMQALAKLRDQLTRRLGMSVSLYAGEGVNRLSELRRSYTSANEAAKHKYAENREVILFEQIKNQPLYVFDMSQELCQELIMHVEEGNRTEYYAAALSMFRQFQEQRFAPQAVASALSRCFGGIQAVIKEMGGMDERLQHVQELAERDYLLWSLKLLQEHVLSALEEADDYIAQLRKEQQKGDIHRIKKYIDAHYCDNISLKSIAARFYMNAVYLGRLFRKSYGVYFNEYVLTLRVQEAKRLLRQTDLRIYEIAARIGIPNADYFVTQFEKLERLTPTEYRNKLLVERERGDQ